MILVLVTAVAAVLAEFLGVSAAVVVLALLWRNRVHFLLRTTVAFTLFAAHGVLWGPAVRELDVVFSVRNRELAEFFEIAPNTPIATWYAVGIDDWLLWVVEALLSAALAGFALARVRSV